jgi:hypothetical protein
MLIRSLWEALPMLATGDHQVLVFRFALSFYIVGNVVFGF